MVYSCPNIRLLAVLFSVINTFACYGYAEGGLNECAHSNDSKVVIFAKRVWHMDWAFVDEECEQKGATVYGIHSSSKRDQVFITREINKQIARQLIESAYSAEDLKRMSERGSVFGDILSRIDSSFFDLTNQEKQQVLDTYYKKQIQNQILNSKLFILPHHPSSGRPNRLLAACKQIDCLYANELIERNDVLPMLVEIVYSSNKKPYCNQHINTTDAAFLYIDTLGKRHYLIISGERLFDLTNKVEYQPRDTVSICLMKDFATLYYK